MLFSTFVKIFALYKMFLFFKDMKVLKRKIQSLITRMFITKSVSDLRTQFEVFILKKFLLTNIPVANFIPNPEWNIKAHTQIIIHKYFSCGGTVNS